MTTIAPQAMQRHYDKTILVVDDEEMVLRTMKAILEWLGYRVIGAATGSQGWNVWQESHREIDLVITDLIMPGPISGRALTKLIRARQPDAAIIMMSGYTGDAFSGDDALTEGEVFLPKPFTVHSVATAIQRCLFEEGTVAGRIATSDSGQSNETLPALPSASRGGNGT